MIGALTGKVILRDDPYIIIDVNGVGYRVNAASDILSSLKLNSELSVFTFTYVREDELGLFGFSKYQDLKLFESLINVSGVGPRTAISIFSIGDGDSIRKAIMDADMAFFKRVPRLGNKNAQKIIIELKNKLGGEGELNLSGENKKARAEISSALKTFGFSGKEIEDAIKNIDGAKPIEEQITLALKYLGK